jgi:hypothetical protein
MNPSTTEEFFSIQLSPEGSQYLLRLYKLNRWVFGLSALFYVINLSTSLHFFTTHQVGIEDKFDLVVSLILSPIFWALMNTLWLIHTYLFLRFNSICKKAIQTGQSDLFNQSFKWMYRSLVVALVQLILEIPFGILTFLGEIGSD